MWTRDTPGQLSSLLLVHTPCIRDQTPTSWSRSGLCPGSVLWACPVHVMCIPQIPEMDEAQVTGPGSLEVWALVPYPLRGRYGGGGGGGKGCHTLSCTSSLCSLS